MIFEVLKLLPFELANQMSQNQTKNATVLHRANMIFPDNEANQIFSWEQIREFTHFFYKEHLYKELEAAKRL